MRMIAAMAVIKNPWSGRAFVENLKPEIHDVAPVLGELLTGMIVEAAGSGAAVEGYGKAAVVGLDGEIEHASALIHTLRFGNTFREAVSGSTFLSFTNTRTGPGALISLPMIHKSETGKRSHFITATFQIADAPGPDEIVVAIGASDGGRAHPRIADRFEDMKELEAERTGREVLSV